MDEILTLREVAVWLRIHRMTVYRLVHKRMIPAFRVASEWRFDRRDLELWLEQITVMGRHYSGRAPQPAEDAASRRR